MLSFFVIVVILSCAAVFMNEGLYSATTLFFCSLFAGVIAFCSYETPATWLESSVGLGGYADIVAILGIFSLVVNVLRVVTELLAPTMVEFPDIVHRGGGLIVGAATGWMLSGILLAAVQTLPLHQNFLGYNYRDLEKGNAWNVDRRWLAFVHRVSSTGLAWSPPHAFDPVGDYIIRYHRYRRTSDEGTVLRAADPGASGAPATRPNTSGAGGRRRGV